MFNFNAFLSKFILLSVYLLNLKVHSVASQAIVTAVTTYNGVVASASSNSSAVNNFNQPLGFGQPILLLPLYPQSFSAKNNFKNKPSLNNAQVFSGDNNQSYNGNEVKINSNPNSQRRNNNSYKNNNGINNNANVSNQFVRSIQTQTNPQRLPQFGNLQNPGNKLNLASHPQNNAKPKPQNTIKSNPVKLQNQAQPKYQTSNPGQQKSMKSPIENFSTSYDPSSNTLSITLPPQLNNPNILSHQNFPGAINLPTNYPQNPNRNVQIPNLSNTGFLQNPNWNIQTPSSEYEASYRSTPINNHQLSSSNMQSQTSNFPRANNGDNTHFSNSAPSTWTSNQEDLIGEASVPQFPTDYSLLPSQPIANLALASAISTTSRPQTTPRERLHSGSQHYTNKNAKNPIFPIDIRRR